MLIPVFPPILLSTCANKVVGMLINFSPLLKILAANPETSPTTPPPTAIKESFLLKLYFSITVINLFTLCWSLFFSLEENLYKITFFLIFCFNFLIILNGTLLSNTIKYFSDLGNLDFKILSSLLIRFDPIKISYFEFAVLIVILLFFIYF